MVSDTLSQGPDRPPRRPPRWTLPAAVAVLVAVAAAAYLARQPGPDRETTAPSTASPISPIRTVRTVGPSGTAPPGATVALLLGSGHPVDGTMDRHDPNALGGPYTVVVRGSDGSLGHHGAVVTYPVDAAADTSNSVVWPLAGEHARVRGDLPHRSLREVARNTRVVDGRPVVDPPQGLRVVATGPYRSPHVRSVRYPGTDVPGDLGGLVYTGVLTGGGFEDQLYEHGARRAGTVDGSPAVVSAVKGGNGTLAWQLRPGVVGYVGYSGSELDDGVVRTLRRLAAGAEGVDLRHWQAIDPYLAEGENDYR